MISPARWVSWSALIAVIAVPCWGTPAISQTIETIATDSGVRLPGADSVPATGGWLPRLQVAATVGTIRADSIVPTAPVFQFTDLMMARLPGVDVQSGGGMSGSGARIIIRGGGSIIAGTDPVVYLDGVRIAADPGRSGATGESIFTASDPTQLGRLEDLTPNEIERVDVLAGPAATTQYGLDAWNGVILVTTRRPNPGAPHWSAYAEDGVLTPPPPRVADSYMPWGHATSGGGGEGYCATFDQAQGACMIDSVTHYSALSDPRATPFTNGSRDRFGLQVGGGAGPGRYFVSGDRESEMGVLQMPASELPNFESQFGHAPNFGQLHPNSLDRTNLRGTLGLDLGEHGDISIFGNSMGGVHRTSDDGDLAQDAALVSGATNAGWQGIAGRPSVTFADEVADRVERYVYGANATLRPASFVAFHLAAGADRSDSHQEGLKPVFTPCGGACGDYGETTEHVATDDYTGDAGATATIPAGHSLVFRTDAGVQYREQRQIDTVSTGFSPIGQPFVGSTVLHVGSDGIQRGAYVEETVTWAEQLTLTAAVHGEGAHGLLGKGSQGFPRLAGSWVAWRRGDDMVRVHAAYGVSGDLPVIQATPAAIERSQFTDSPPFSGGAVPDLPPEMEYIHEGEAGVDGTAAQDRLTAGVTVYQRTIDNMAIPFSFFLQEEGFPIEEYSNLGSVQNRGIELTLDIGAVRTPVVRWDANINAWGNQNRVESYGGVPPNPINGFLIAAGHPLYAISQSTLSYRDINEDGVIEPNEITLGPPTDQGSSRPTRGAAVQNTVILFGDRFRIGALIDYTGGNKLIDPVLALQLRAGITRATADAHAPLAEQAEAIAAEFGNGGSGFYSGPVQDGSFVRFRELSFTVNASQRIARALRTNSAAVSLVARNLWLWTPYRGTDPEINTDGNVDPVISNTVIPQPRYFVARVTLGY